ncbi:HD domain-containing protein [Salinispora arenicola]|uniref:HD domain-containing protein n=1 Tax=Salinispora arenicola TaxID=168697 RepID=UPI000577A4F5|nr:HD domain-containing protein [Salinispora arenicola]
MAALVDTAWEAARQLLETPLPRRWSHVQAVVAKAERISAAVPVEDRDVLVASAWLHDVGYSPDLVDTGFHSLDGGRWLRRERYDQRIAALVAHHSCAWLEAEERGLDEVLAAEFPREETAVTDALCFSDMTTGPDGQDFKVLERLAEIRSRYGPEHLVTRFIGRAEPEMVVAVQRTQRRLAGDVLLSRCRAAGVPRSRG